MLGWMFAHRWVRYTKTTSFEPPGAFELELGETNNLVVTLKIV